LTLVYISLAWILGIALGSRVHLPAALLAVSLLPLPILAIRRANRRAVITATVCLLALIGAALYYPLHLPPADASDISFYHGQDKVTLKGLISSPPETNGKNAQFRFSAAEIKTGETWQKVSGTALVYVPAYAEYHYGDLLILNGKLEVPPVFDDFDYRDYLAHQGISTIVYYPHLEVVAHGQGSKILGRIYDLRHRLGQTIAQTMPEPQASLAQGIVLGLRSNIPEDLNQNFARTGTTHVLAVSGLNLSIIAGVFVSLGIWLFGRRHYFYIWLALAAIWFYALITGMQAPVVRSAIMASIAGKLNNCVSRSMPTL